MIRVLFVCLGNICRSPIAEETFRQLVKEKGLADQILCDSAGTHNYHIGDLPDYRTRRNAESHGLKLTHRCRRLSVEDFSKFSYIMAMDESNLENIILLSRKFTGLEPNDDQVFLLREFDPVSGNLIVPDPYYEPDNFFENVYQIVHRSNKAFLDFLIEKNALKSQGVK